DTAGLSLALEPPPGAGELDEHALGIAPCDAGELERGESRGRVPAVVLARNGELELDRLELLGADDLRDMRKPLLEERGDLGTRTALDATGVRGRDVGLPAGRRPRRLVGDRDVDPFEVGEVRRLDAIPARDLGSPGMRDGGVGAHAGAADSGEPEPSTGERLR